MPTYVLQDIPWGFKYPGVQYFKSKKVHVYKGATLPEALRPFQTQDFSYARWREDELNGTVFPTQRSKTVFTPHDHQKEGAKSIFQAYARGNSGFLLADSTGLGKTLSVLAGITAIARAEKKRGKYKNERATVLVVCPKGVIPGWRQTIQSFPISTEFLRPLVINYHQLNKLLNPPAASRLGKKTRTKNRNTAKLGTPTVNWDYIVFDEAHYLKSFPSSTMSVAAVNIAQLTKKYERGKSPFVVYSTATPGASPLNFAVMSQMMSPLLDKVAKKKVSGEEFVSPEDWGGFLKSHGFDVKAGKVGWRWGSTPWFGKNSEDPVERQRYEEAVAKAKKNQRQDAIKIGKALKLSDAPFIMRKPQDIAGWPEQNTIPLPTELELNQVPIYQEAWNRFRQFLNLSPKGADPKGALVEQLRYRQKSSLLKVDQVAEHIIDQVENGNQVYVSCQFTETIDKYKEILMKKKIKVGEISGRNSAEREDERIAFQKGETQVILSSVVEGISLHAGETLPDGSKATENERITIIHDIRQNNLDTTQALGRAHRDGKHSIAYFPYFLDTIDEKIVKSFANKTANMKAMTGASAEESEHLEDLFRQAAAGNS